MPLAILCVLAGSFFGFANPFMHWPELVLLYIFGLAYIGMHVGTYRGAFMGGFMVGGVANTACLYWIAIPVVEFGELPWIAAVPCAMFLGFYIALFNGLFCMAARFLSSRLRPIPAAMLAGLIWTSLEWVRGFLFTGFPWLSAYQAFAPRLEAIQATAVIGGYGLSGLAAMSIVGFAVALDQSLGERKVLREAALFGIMVLFGIYGYGHWALKQPEPVGKPFTISLAQGNFNQAEKWEPANQKRTVERYVALSQESAKRDRPDLAVWPETAMPFYFQEKGPLRDLVERGVARMRVPLLLGAPAFKHKAMENPVMFNRAYLLDQTGKEVGAYEKQHLVPFGEYTPFGDVFPFLKDLIPYIGDFAPGPNKKPLPVGPAMLGGLICYESIFPEIARERVADGANVLVNISNDAWYLRSSAAAQHLQLSLFRAVEQGRWIARGTNTGITAFIDPRGRVVSRTNVFEEANLVHTVDLLEHKTVFHRIFPALHPAIFGVSVLALLVLKRKTPIRI